MKRSDLILKEVELILTVVFCITIVLLCARFLTSLESADAYSDAQEAAQQVMLNDRFILADGGKCNADIIVDSETGVCYLWKSAGYKGGLTVLVDSVGNPVIWEE